MEKRNQLIKLFTLCSFVFIVFVLAGCSQKIETNTIYLEDAFSVSPYVIIYSSEKFYTKNKESIQNECNTILQSLDEKFDCYNEESMIFKVNQKAGVEDVKVDSEFALILSTALQTSSNVNEKYDVTVYPLVLTWGFRDKYYRNNNYFNAPTADAIEASKSLINYKNVKLKTVGTSEGNQYYVRFEQNGMKIDLGSIVKGYATDKIAACLKSHQVTDAIINIGGNVYTFGDRSYNVGITTPFYEKYNDEQSIVGYLTVEKKNYTFVTTGTYERYIKSESGTMYHHILDIATGYPSQNDLVAVTIVKYSEEDNANISIDADALSTAVFLLGQEAGLNYIEKTDGIEAIFITTSNEVIYSSGLKDSFTYNREVTSCGFSIRGD